MSGNFLLSLLSRPSKQEDWTVSLGFAYVFTGCGLAWVSAGIYWYWAAEDMPIVGAAVCGLLFILFAVAAILASYVSRRRSEGAHSLGELANSALKAIEPTKELLQNKNVVSGIATAVTLLTLYKLVRHK